MPELPVIHPTLGDFGSESRPLRPSKVSKLLACPMSQVLDHDSEGGKAAQTGSLIHAACHVYHTTKGDQRVAAGVKALELARESFPLADVKKAEKVFKAYTEDQENEKAEVVWCEQSVTLRLDSDTGPIVIRGTLDQVRRHRDGTLRVWDIKTGDTYSAAENVVEYSIQQAVYTLAARESLDASILPGGLIYTPNYGRMKSSAHVSLGLTVEQCRDLLVLLPAIVSSIRRGIVPVRPSIAGCKWCPHQTFPKCLKLFRGLYG